MSLESVAVDQKVIDPTHTLDLKMDFEKSPLHNDRDGIGEIQNTRTIDMSKEKKNIIDNEEHLVTHDLIPIPSVRQDHFRLLDLPIELRNYIYSFLLPYNVIISHKRRRFLSTYHYIAVVRKSNGFSTPPPRSTEKMYASQSDASGKHGNMLRSRRKCFLSTRQSPATRRVRYRSFPVSKHQADFTSGSIRFEYLHLHHRWPVSRPNLSSLPTHIRPLWRQRRLASPATPQHAQHTH
jgi:hypothetical protein